jgi:hypothetical protein
MAAIWRCDECGETVNPVEIVVPHPKPDHEPVECMQCPECGEVGQFTSMCDTPGCDKQVSAGWPSPQGYRHTCFEHSKLRDTNRSS